MDGRIGHLHCRYQVVGGTTGAGTTAARLDRLARERVAKAWGQALEKALGDDPAVYILRRVDVQLALELDKAGNDTSVAQAWGERLAGAVIRNIAHDPDDGSNLIRFADHADYVAHFVQDLLQGQAWGRWFYGAFVTLRSQRTPDAVKAVLRDNREHLPKILGYLHRYGVLDPVVAVLDQAMLDWLWAQGLGAYVRPEPEALRPCFAVALALMDDFNWWTGSSPEREILFQRYLSAGPPIPDWQDQGTLADAVLDVFRFLADQGFLQPESIQTLDLNRLAQAVADVDWLDSDRLQRSLVRFLDSQVGKDTALPTRPRGQGPTPRQRRLLADLLAAWQESNSGLDRSQPDTASNALRWYAWLMAQAPDWTGDAAATALIGRLLSAWRWTTATASPNEFLVRLRRGDIVGATRLLPSRDQVAAQSTLDALAELGEPGLALIETLMDEEEAATSDRGEALETSCAGLFLLLRALLDVRLPLLVESTGLGELSAVLLALGLRWAGNEGSAQERVDHGLRLWAGIDPARTLDEMRELWAGVPSTALARFQHGLLRILAGQRLIVGTAMHVYTLPLTAECRALIAGDGGGIWPLGRLIDAEQKVSEPVAEWAMLWEKATGEVPTPIVHEADNHGDDPGRQALTAALDALGGLCNSTRHLRLPDADLTMALTAIALLRVWARWLPRFADASIPYLVTNCIRRPGQIALAPDTFRVTLAPRPLDVVIEMAGYTAEMERVSWLGRQVQFRIQEA